MSLNDKESLVLLMHTNLQAKSVQPYIPKQALPPLRNLQALSFWVSSLRVSQLGPVNLGWHTHV